MFRKGEYVIYGNNGICCIEEIGVPRDTPLETAGRNITRLRRYFPVGKFMRLWIRRYSCARF